MTRSELVLFLFILLFIQNSLNESNQVNSNQNNFSTVEHNKTTYSFLKTINGKNFYIHRDDKKPILKYYIVHSSTEQKLFERNKLCSSLKNLKCSDLPPECLDCNFNYECVYGNQIETTCKPFEDYKCEGPTEFNKIYECAYCYQLPQSNYTCAKVSTCKAYSRYVTNCTVDKKVFCLGNRKFNKFIKCQLKSNMKWSYALIFSVTLGGTGMDRFYLGNWQEGFGKLFSFGGLGFWTLIDVILIWIGYLKPVDGNYS